jgi:hypothetical protein
MKLAQPACPVETLISHSTLLRNSKPGKVLTLATSGTVFREKDQAAYAPPLDLRSLVSGAWFREAIARDRTSYVSPIYG